jgi:hypothetical protein
MSLLSLTMMTILFLRETYAFLHTQFHSSVVINYDEFNSDNGDGTNDNDADGQLMKKSIRLNFNVTLYDVQCDFASVGE